MALRRWYFPFFTGLIILGLSLPVMAQDTGGVESINEHMADPAYYGQPVMPYGQTAAPPVMPGYYYGQGYTPYPQQAVMPQPVKQPWYKRLLSPMTKRMNPPILREPKVPNETAKENPMRKEPLIRLAKGIQYNGQSVPPGLYLLSLTPAGADAGATLSIYRQQKILLTVPAVAVSGTNAQGLQSNELPPPPGKTPQVTSEEATGLVELAENGQNVILIYQTKDLQYTSIPVTIGESYLEGI